MNEEKLKEGFRSGVVDFRSHLAWIRKRMSVFKAELIAMENPSAESGIDKNESIANVILSIRHLEDAEMRLGRALGNWGITDAFSSPGVSPEKPSMAIPGGVPTNNNEQKDKDAVTTS